MGYDHRHFECEQHNFAGPYDGSGRSELVRGRSAACYYAMDLDLVRVASDHRTQHHDYYYYRGTDDKEDHHHHHDDDDDDHHHHLCIAGADISCSAYLFWRNRYFFLPGG